MQPTTVTDPQSAGLAWEANPIGNPPAGYSSPQADAINAQNAQNASQMQLAAQQASSGALNMPAGTHTDTPGTGYDMSNPNTTALLSKTYGISPAQLQQIGSAYQAQYGQNIGTDALMRAVNESSGNYLWGPTPGQTVAQTQAAHPGATVTDPTAINQLPFGTAQNGAYTPNAGVAAGTPGSVPIAPNSAITAPLTNNPLAPFVSPNSPNDFKSAMANTTNLINQTGGGATAGLLNQLGTTAGGTGTPTTGTTSAPSSGDAALQALSNSAGQIQNPFDLLQAREQALGIPAAQQQVSGLRQAVTNTTNLLNKIAPSVEGRTADSLVNEAQANKMIQNEQAPVQANLQSLGQQSSDAQSALTNLMAQATSEAGLQAQGQEQAFNNLQTLATDYQNSDAAKQAQQNFMLQQAQSAEQFQQNLALQVSAQQITKDAAAEATKEFNIGQQNEQQDFANTQFWEGINHADALAQQATTNAQAQQQLDQSGKASASGSSSGGGAAKTPAPTAQNVTAALRSQISGSNLVGSDGHVSPSTLAAMYNTWMSYGLSDSGFWSSFQGLWNPKENDYQQLFNTAKNSGKGL